MADIENSTGDTPISQEVPEANKNEEMKHDSGDDYSSGSDRSFEADDAEDGRGSGGPNEDAARSARRRKRRHGSHGSRRHKGGLRHKYRPFLPYPDKDEIGTTLKRKSLELQEKENAAAVLRRDEGQDQFVTFPVAPFNSTQFLMDEHSVGSPKTLARTGSYSKLSVYPQDNISSVTTPKDDSSDISYFRKDNEFADIYTIAHAENLQSMPKDVLVKHYMNLEEQIEVLQKKVAEAEQQKDGDIGKQCKSEVDQDKDSVSV